MSLGGGGGGGGGSIGGRMFERETKLLGQSPTSIIDDIAYAIEDYTCDGLDEVEKAFTAIPGLAPYRHSIATSLDTILMNRLMPVLVAQIEKFEYYVNTNIFTIPAHIVLPGEQPAAVPAVSVAPPPTPIEPEQLQQQQQLQQPSKDEEDALDEEIKQLQEQVAVQQLMNTFMKRELKQLSAELSKYEATFDSFDFQPLPLETFERVAKTHQQFINDCDAIRSIAPVGGTAVTAAASSSSRSRLLPLSAAQFKQAAADFSSKVNK